MKKLITVLLIIAMLLIGCGKAAEPTETTTDVATETTTETATEATTETTTETASGSTSETIDPNADSDSVKRWYDGDMLELIPSIEYGALYPYLGKVVELSDPDVLSDEEPETKNYYGLCTADGTLVTDPIYTDISYNNGRFLLNYSYDDGQGEEYTRAFVASADGSYVNKLYEGRGKFVCYAPDVYCVIESVPNTDPNASTSYSYSFMHENGKDYDTDISGGVFSENGFLIYREYDIVSFFGHFNRILDKYLHIVGDYEYKGPGAYGQAICKTGNGYAVINTNFEKLYSNTNEIIFYDGQYYIKNGQRKLTQLDGDFMYVKQITFPFDIDSIVMGYVFDTRGEIYTINGETTQFTGYSSSLSDEILFSQNGSLILKYKGKYMQQFIPNLSLGRDLAFLYPDAMVIQKIDGIYLYNLQGEYIGEVDDFDYYSYTLENGETKIYPRDIAGLSEYIMEDGVINTYSKDSGELLVSLSLK